MSFKEDRRQYVFVFELRTGKQYKFYLCDHLFRSHHFVSDFSKNIDVVERHWVSNCINQILPYRGMYFVSQMSWDDKCYALQNGLNILTANMCKQIYTTGPYVHSVHDRTLRLTKYIFLISCVKIGVSRHLK